MFNYANMFLNGERIPANPKEAAKYYLMSANKGKAKEIFFYGKICLKGLSVQIYKKEGFKFIKKAFNKKHVSQLQDSANYYY